MSRKIKQKANKKLITFTYSTLKSLRVSQYVLWNPNSGPIHIPTMYVRNIQLNFSRNRHSICNGCIPASVLPIFMPLLSLSARIVPLKSHSIQNEHIGSITNMAIHIQIYLDVAIEFECGKLCKIWTRRFKLIRFLVRWASAALQ